MIDWAKCRMKWNGNGSCWDVYDDIGNNVMRIYDHDAHLEIERAFKIAAASTVPGARFRLGAQVVVTDVKAYHAAAH